MATWKKMLLWLAGGLIAAFGGCVAMLNRLPDLCATKVFEQTSSPDGKRKAVLFQVDCGATTDFNSHVVIVDGGLDASKPNSLPKSFFVADSNHGRAPAGITGGPEVRVDWLSDSLLEVKYHQFSRVIRSDEQAAGVEIRYTAFK
jgi:hypothetical protein